MGCPSLFSPEGKVALMLLKSYTGFSDADLVSHLNGNIHFQLFCGVYIHPSRPLTNHKIESVDKHYIRPIVRGKETRNVKFGAKVNNIQMDGISFIEHLSFNAFNEGTNNVSSCNNACSRRTLKPWRPMPFTPPKHALPLQFYRVFSRVDQGNV